jgi:hypothetical protein
LRWICFSQVAVFSAAILSFEVWLLLVFVLGVEKVLDWDPGM